VSSFVPKDGPVGQKQLGYCESLDFPDQSIGAERVAYVASACIGFDRIQRGACPVLHFLFPNPLSDSVTAQGGEDGSDFFNWTVSRLPIAPPGAPFLSLVLQKRHDLLQKRHGPPSEKGGPLVVSDCRHGRISRRSSPAGGGSRRRSRRRHHRRGRRRSCRSSQLRA
jgi:hypothetical protein